MAAITIYSDFGAPPKVKSATVSTVFLFAMKWWDQMPWSQFSECWALSQLFHSSFTFVKRLSSSSISAVRVVSSPYLRFLIFLLAILIPACASSSLIFCMMYLAYRLNKQGDNIQPWHTTLPIWNQSFVSHPVLTAASWPACKFFKRQVMWSAIPISFRIFHNLLWKSQFIVIHTVKDFSIVNKAEIDVFSGTLLLFQWSSIYWQLDLWLLCLF